MRNPIIHFILFALIGFGLGYIVFDVVLGDSNETEIVSNPTPTDHSGKKEPSPTEKGEKENSSATEEGNILQTKGCLGCHAVNGLNLDGGATGPDLSKAYTDVEGKHGKPLQEFLKAPTSAVMSSVIAGNPLSDEEITQISDELKKASEAQ